ncbi:LysM peptidoglycan-binding domain-containing protein [Bacillus massiliigorillae]|uniref:LysM peptidoglycan-binding domain-containing protein n=1 Tax=Bacillus massiliigorillae TaxID=1243664 RepID=UPI001E65D61B|nr:LysM domain-containing protein [Bacillus massiliigorillae]
MHSRFSDVIQYVIQPWDTIPMIAQRFNIPMDEIVKANPRINSTGLFIGQILNIPNGLRDEKCMSESEYELRSDMRSLWEQHVAWTRMAIMSLVFNLPDVNVVLTRLLQNAPDMGDSLRPFYGKRNAKKYSELIKEHLLIAADLVKVAIAGNTQEVERLEKKWYANGDDIVQFLSSINPNFPKEEFRKMFYEHLALTKAEAVAMITKDYKTSVELYNKIEAEALEMADEISDAIVKQFPRKFK